MPVSRRTFVQAGAAAAMAAASSTSASAQGQQGGHAGHPGHESPYSHLTNPDIKGPEQAAMDAVRFTYSPAPAAAQMGRWRARANLPIPRSEMAWATVCRGTMHVIGGYGIQRVDRPYHHVFDPAANTWADLAPLPFGANHVGVDTLDNRYIYAIGGYIEQNRAPHSQCFVYDADANSWKPIANLTSPRGAIAVSCLNGLVHCVGGRDVRSVETHEVYDPKTNRWSRRAPLPGMRDHIGNVVLDGRIHMVGGRKDTFDFNTGLHHVYDAQKDAWEQRAPMPTPRSGHGAVVMGGRIFTMGGEGTRRVFGQVESYDPKTDKWEHHTPMLTPRHGLGAVAIGNAIYVAGGGVVVGGAFQTSVNEEFTLA
ncbi:MAG: galactose oxidase [Variibacter sp.]|nr:galactose oxidase [Variibacter sp.]